MIYDLNPKNLKGAMVNVIENEKTHELFLEVFLKPLIPNEGVSILRFHLEAKQAEFLKRIGYPITKVPAKSF